MQTQALPTLEERIERTFDVTFEEFLMEDVGFVKFHRWNPVNPKENWGIIESTNGDVLFFTKNVREYNFNGGSRPNRSNLMLTGPLSQGQAVTFTVMQKEDDDGRVRLRAPEVLLWQPERFEGIQLAIEQRPLYRFVRTRPEGGGLGATSGDGKDEVLWRGRNVCTLRRMFPEDRWPTRAGDVSGRHFETLNRHTDQWEACDDPR